MIDRPFHITLVRPPGYVHASALAEAVTYVAEILVACGYRAQVTENWIVPGAINVVACAHLLSAAQVAQLPTDSIILNGEPLADPAVWQLASGVYRDVLARFHVWDYARPNLVHLGHSRATVLPFWFAPGLVRALPRSDGDHLLFYGVMTDRRRVIVDAISERGVSVEVRFGCYGEERDRAMLGALAVLNLHQQDDPRLFQPIRCFHPLINEVPVISEETTDPSAEAFRTAATFLAVDGFADRVAELVADRAAFRVRARAATRTFAMLDPVPAFRAAVERYVRAT